MARSSEGDPLKDSSAVEIYRAYLAAACVPFEAGDYEACVPFFDLPHRMETLDRVLVCSTEAELIHALATYGKAMRARGIKHMKRDVETAHFLNSDEIEGFHVTSGLRNGERVVEPFATRNRIVRRNGVWRSAEQTGVLTSADFHIVPIPEAAALTQPSEP